MPPRPSPASSPRSRPTSRSRCVCSSGRCSRRSSRSGWCRAQAGRDARPASKRWFPTRAAAARAADDGEVGYGRSRETRRRARQTGLAGGGRRFPDRAVLIHLLTAAEPTATRYVGGVASGTPMDKALRLLALRSRTAQELDRALAKTGVASTDRESALARLRELGYIDDREVARARARTRVGQGDAPRLAAKRLAAAGIDGSDAREAAGEAAEGAEEAELAAKALQRRLRGRKPQDLREKQRLLRGLVARGHRPSAVAKAVGIEWEGGGEHDERWRGP